MNARPTPDEIEFGRFRIQFALRRLLVDDEPARLKARAFDVLQALVAHRGRPVGKDELLELVWPGLVVEENNLQVHISALRKVLGPQSIATIPGRGYQFILPASSDATDPLGQSRRRAPSRAKNDQAVHPNNLPPQLTSFIGRKSEIAATGALMDKARILTLTGTGGCGKTRLSLEVAAALLSRFPDGVWFAELAGLADPGRLPQVVASTLGMKEVPGTPLTRALVEHLTHKRLLLVLDNCEHLLEASASFVDTVVRHCTGVNVLATSREALRIGGERVYRVPPLSLPAAEETPTPQSLSRYDSIRLFAERAQLVREDFHITLENAPALASLCCHLDGIPLAIELAAARVRTLTVEDIEARLDHRFALLAGGLRAATPRHQTLRSLIDWSYDMLSEAEQLLLQRLSVFAGGWTTSAAETVCAGDSVKSSDVLDLLTQLCDKSLVVAESTGGHSRYRLLETLRQYALEKLIESGAEEPVRRQHRDFYLALAEEAAPNLLRAQQVGWLRRLDVDYENLLAALDWSLAESGSQVGLRFCGALDLYWFVRGHFAEGLQRCIRLLDKTGAEKRTRDRAKALDAAAHMAFMLGDYRANRAWREEGLAIMRDLGDRKGIAQLQLGLGNLDRVQGDFSSARARDEESLDIMRDMGDQRGIARSLHRLGSVALFQRDFPAARALLDESLSMARNLGDRVLVAYVQHFLGLLALFENDLPAARAMFEDNLANSRDLGEDIGTADALSGLGHVALRQGDCPAARSLFYCSLAMGRAHGDRLAVAYGLEAMAEVAAASGNAARAACVYGAAEQLRNDLASPLPPAWQPIYDRSVAASRSALGDDATFNRAWQEGRALSLDQAMDLALQPTAACEPPCPYGSDVCLSKRGTRG